MWQDLRGAFRSLCRQRAFSSAALLTLGLGIGTATAMLTVIDAVLLRPLPYPDPERLVQLSEIVPGGTPAVSGPIISNLTIHAWEPHRRTIGTIAHFGGGTATLGGDNPRRVGRGAVGPRFFEVLGVQPRVGRFFRDEDAVPEAPPVAVISDELWRDEFGRQKGAIGRTLVLDDRPHEVIGVAPAGIPLPTVNVRVWTTVRVAPTVAVNGRDARVELTRAIARLAPDATARRAADEGTAVARTVSRPIAAEMLFGKGAPVEIHVRTVADQLTHTVRPALLLLLVGVAMLLLITCSNVANLFLSRGVARDREYAIRVALGATRPRLVRQTCAETILTSAAGGIVGATLAAVLLEGLPALAPADFPRLDVVGFDWRSLMAALVTTAVAGALTALVPAARSARADLVFSLRNGVGASSGPRGLAAQRLLLVGEAALAMVLLVGAALMGRSFVNLMQTDRGYDPEDVLTARIYLPGASRGQADTHAFVSTLLDRVRALPGVVHAGASNMAPFGQSTFVSAFEVAPRGRERTVARAQSYVVTPGYAEALRLRLKAGRLLVREDLAARPGKILVNEEFVRLFLGGTDPLGLQFDGQNGTGEIVGVVGNVFRSALDRQAQAEIYLLTGERATIRREVYLLVRGSGDASSYATPIRQIIATLRRDAAVEAIEPLNAQLSASVAQPRFAAGVLTAFAALALLLASIGLYGSLSYWVRRRHREIGIRTALGATSATIVRSVLREGVVLTAVGLLLGGLLALISTPLMATLLIGVAPLDRWSFALATLVLLAVAIAASVLPARRATRVDALVALRSE